jgi:hypothetical protein
MNGVFSSSSEMGAFQKLIFGGDGRRPQGFVQCMHGELWFFSGERSVFDETVFFKPAAE